VRRLRATFSSLENRNYRKFFAGHALSSVGLWMQRIGQAWLVLELTGSGTILGVTAALQHLPILLLGPWGGLLADRMNQRRLLLWTESLSGLCALTLGVLASTGLVQIWMVLALAVGLGAADAMSRAAKKSFIYEMVGPGLLTNAVTLHAVMFNAAKVIGPAIAGILIATVGIAASFYANAASYLGFAIALALIPAGDLKPAERAVRGRGQLREGLRYVVATPQLSAPLLLMAVSGMFAYEWAVTLPLLAVGAFGGDAQTFGVMFSAMGAGAVVGGLIVAGSLVPSRRNMLRLAWLFSGLVLLVAVTPSLPVVLAVLVVLGGASVALRSVATALLQIRAAPQMRGRVMSLLAVAIGGTTPIGAPLVGWIGEAFGARYPFALGGLASAAATLAAIWLLRRHRRRLWATPG
jgi:MFS family permease